MNKFVFISIGNILKIYIILLDSIFVTDEKGVSGGTIHDKVWIFILDFKE
jgi:hypothetical protein